MRPPEVDYAVVDRLRDVGGDALVRRLVRLFLVTSEEAVQRMAAGLDHQALDITQSAAHHLFASAAQLKLSAVENLARRLEDAARARDGEAARALFAELRPALAATSAALRTLLQELPQAARIAVIDDSEDIRVLLRLVLETHFDITEYESAAGALQGMRRFPPDLVIIDVSLPDMSGVELLQCMRAESVLRAVPAIALTALSSIQDGTFESAGFALHVRKPVLDTDSLIGAVNHLLARHPA